MSAAAGNPPIDDAKEDAIVAWLDGRLGTMVEELRALVAISTGPSEVAGRREAIALLAHRWRRMGLSAEIIEAAGGLCHLLVHRKADVADAPRVLLLGHVDTVFDEASGFVGLSRAGDLIGGPGVADMKGGLVVAAAAVEALGRAGKLGAFDWQVLITTDEEIGSPTSRAIVERLAHGRDIVLCFEPGRGDFAVVTSRAGVGAFSFVVHGQASHAGAQPDAGRNAIHAAADLIRRLQGLADASRGTTVSVGTISGGSARNVVAETCRLEVDARAWEPQEAERVSRGIAEAVAEVQAEAGVRVEQRGRFHRPPWPRNAACDGLHEHFARVAKDLGLALPAVSSAGGSDASLTAAVGVATLDGLGPVGSGFHSTREQIEHHTLAERAKLVALALLRYRASSVVTA